MARYLIEVRHEPDVESCARCVQVFLASGSHLLTHADWGCLDGQHYAWIIADMDSKDEARRLVPPAFRADARIIGLNKFSMETLDSIMSRHELRGYREYTGPSLGEVWPAQDARRGLQKAEVRLQK
jgi:hypothetical protein